MTLRDICASSLDCLPIMCTTLNTINDVVVPHEQEQLLLYSKCGLAHKAGGLMG